MKLRAFNPPLERTEKSFLSQAYSTGATSLKVVNDNLFVVGSKLLIGEMGQERSEIVTVATVTTPGTDFTISSPGLIYPHNADTPVYVIKYDKVRYYRSTTGVAGAYTLLQENQIDVDNASRESYYDDLTGLSSYYYKVSFYSTLDATESTLSDPIAGGGYPRGTAGEVINEFFVTVADPTQTNMNVGEALDLMNEVNNDIISQSRRPYRFLKTSKLLDVAAGNNRISLPTNLSKFDRLLFTNAFDQRTDDYQRLDMVEMEYISYDNTMAVSDNLLYYSIDESTNEIVLFPTPKTASTGSIKVFYWRNFNEITGLASTLETPNSRIYKLFLLGRYYMKRAAKEPTYMSLANTFLAEYNTEIVKLQRSNRLDMGTPMSIRPDTNHSRGLRRF